MFYDRFVIVCENAGVSPSKVLTDLDISKGSLSRWKEGGGLTNETVLGANNTVPAIKAQVVDIE